MEEDEKVSIGLTSYDIAKRMYENMNPMQEKNKVTQLASIGAWFSTDPMSDYYCLMCREVYDFTFLHFKNMNYSKGVVEVRDVLESRGTIMDISYNHDNDGYECWVKDSDGEAKMYLLFNASFMVVEIE